MSNVTQLPPSEQDLHAYLDDELAPDERIRVIEWLLDHPDKANELFEIYLREDLLRSSLRHAANNTTLKPVATPPEKKTASRNSGQTNIVFGFLVGIVATLAIVAFTSLLS